MAAPSAFDRAWALLDNHGKLVWTARLCAIGAALLTAALMAMLALLIDLLISRGRIPSFAELETWQRSAFISGLDQFTGDERDAALQRIGRDAAARAAVSQPFEKLGPDEREWLWRGFVEDLLRRRVSSDAADVYARLARTTDPSVTPGMPALGSLSLVVRAFPQRIDGLFGWLAAWNPWSWRPGESGVPNARYLTGLLCLALVVGIIRATLMQIGTAAAAAAGLAVSVRLRRAIYHHTFRLGTLAMESPDRNRAALLFHRSVDAVADAVREKLTSQFFGPLEVIVLLAFALAIHFWLGLAFVLMALIVALVGDHLASSFRRRVRRADRRAAARMELLHESMGMLRLAKCYVMELFNQARVERQLAEYVAARSRRIRVEAWFRPLVWFLGLAAAAVLLYLAGLLVMSGGLGTSQVMVLAATVICLAWPTRQWLKHRQNVKSGRDAAVLIYEFLDRPAELGQAVGADFLDGIDDGVEFRNVSLREPETGRLLLDDVSLAIGAGERVGLIGSDEAEKHAIVYLLARIFDPTDGEIAINGKNLKGLTLESLRSQVSLVLQSDLVFSDTVANNIGCGDASYTMPQIIEAAKIAHAHQFIQRLPYGYETPIGELGASLRPGERFRIALARAILRDPAMFVIEEPIEPLDDDTRRRERWMLATRLDEPLDLAWAGPPDRPDAVPRLAGLGLLRAGGGTLTLTRRGRLLQNAVLQELMEFA